MEKYELVKDIGSGNFGVARLMRNKETKELVAMKYIERGQKIDENVAREIINHRSLRHPNIIRFKEVVLTPICNAGKLADVWSCGVTLYVMLVGAYPFEDQEDPKNFRKTISRIMAIQYKIPDYVHISQDCRHLLSRIFVANPLRRISIKDIKSHPWFLKNLPRELTEAAQATYYKRENPSFSLQSVEDIMSIVEEARKAPPIARSVGGFGWAGEEDEDDNDEIEEEVEEEEDEYEKTVKEAHASGQFEIKDGQLQIKD